jgi:hypothetical protein
VNRVQAQDSLTLQLNRVARLADQHGEYDAADFIRKMLGIKRELAGDLIAAILPPDDAEEDAR